MVRTSEVLHGRQRGVDRHRREHVLGLSLRHGPSPRAAHRVPAADGRQSAFDLWTVGRRRGLLANVYEIPQQNGSRSSTISTDSAVMWAVLRMIGRIAPSTTLTDPSKIVPMMLSWRHIWPSASAPSA